jgi:hypothetical protein
MAISPKEAASFMDLRIKAAIDSLETVIDDQLRVKWYTGSSRVTVYVNGEDWKTPSVAYQLADKYAKKGWTIDSGEETEEGFSIIFGVIRG